MITILNIDNKEKERQLEALMNELKNYKLEMNNREDAFNKIFNAKPLVGTYEPKVSEA
jgi:GTPase involved in cell partitioning and DNA repair